VCKSAMAWNLLVNYGIIGWVGTYDPRLKSVDNSTFGISTAYRQGHAEHYLASETDCRPNKLW
jgi:hypothetical protein